WRVLGVSAGYGESTGVVVSRRVWYDQFNLSASVAGAAIVVNGRTMRITGVAPPWLAGLYLRPPVDGGVPFDEQPDAKAMARGSILSRIAAGRTFEDVRRELPGVNVVRYTGVEPDVHERMARVQAILAWAATFVFLTAAANVAGLLLSR